MLCLRYNTELRCAAPLTVPPGSELLHTVPSCALRSRAHTHLELIFYPGRQRSQTGVYSRPILPILYRGFKPIRFPFKPLQGRNRNLETYFRKRCFFFKIVKARNFNLFRKNTFFRRKQNSFFSFPYSFSY